MSTRPADPGRLLCVGGAPGAGKTTVGALVAGGRRAALVDLDSVATPLVEAVAAGLGVAADLDAPRFAALRDARYACLAAVLADCLRSGVDAVAVAPFTREAADASAWRSWGLALGARAVTTCWLDVDPGTAAARTVARAAARDLAKGAAAPPAAPPVDRAGLDLVLDTSAEVPGGLAARILASWPGR